MNKDSVIKYFIWIVPVIIFAGLVGGVIYYKAKTGGPSANGEVVVNKPKPIITLSADAQAKIDAKIKSANDKIAATPGDQNITLHDLYISLGLNLESEGKFDEALQAYLKSISLAPQLVEGYIDAANIYKIQGFATRAEKYYLQAIDIKPDYFETYQNLAEVYIDEFNKPPQEIKTFYLQALVATNNEPELQRYYADYLESIKDYQSSLQIWQQIILTKPSDSARVNAKIAELEKDIRLEGAPVNQ